VSNKKIRLRKIQIYRNEEIIDLVIYNMRYKLLFAIKEKKFKSCTGLEPYEYNNTVYFASEPQIKKVPWIQICPEDNFQNINFERNENSEFVIDQNENNFYRIGKLLVPIYRYYYTYEVKKYELFPKVHSKIWCSAMDRRPQRFRMRYTNYRNLEIADRTSKEVFENKELGFCRICEPKFEIQKLLDTQLSFNISKILENC
jgi:hypothetical protein